MEPVIGKKMPVGSDALLGIVGRGLNQYARETPDNPRLYAGHNYAMKECGGMFNNGIGDLQEWLKEVELFGIGKRIVNGLLREGVKTLAALRNRAPGSFRAHFGAGDYAYRDTDKWKAMSKDEKRQKLNEVKAVMAWHFAPRDEKAAIMAGERARGKSLREIGRQYGISHESVRILSLPNSELTRPNLV